MSIHLPEDLQRLSRFARREFLCALMSDTKWRKVFAVLARTRWLESQMLVKFIDVEEVRRMRIPGENALLCPLPYIDTFEFGIVELRAIEWLELPSVAVWPRVGSLPRRIVQDLDQMRSVLDEVGQLSLVELPDGIRIEGYKR